MATVTAARSQALWTLYPLRQRIGFLAVLSLVATSNFVDRNVLGILLQPIKAEFRVSDTWLGLLSGLCFALFYAALGIPIARIADRGNRTLIVTLSLVTWSVMCAAAGLAQNFWQLALARVGVGAGEAGAVPPAQSLIADYFPPAQRGRALAVFTLGSTAGYLLGFAGGGWIAQTYGWRMTFIAVGLPGLLLAALTALVLREPRRHAGFAVASAGAPKRESLIETAQALLHKPAFLYVLGSIILYNFLANGALIFTTSFLVRVDGLTLARAGAIFGAVAAGAAVTGSLLGGTIADAAIRRDPRWLTRLCVAGLFLAWPLHLLAFWTANVTVTFVALFVAVVILSGVVPSQYAALHMVCGSVRRATSISIALLLVNLVGLGLGPIVTGALSDHFGASLGPAEGLRTALLIVLSVFVPSAGLMLLAQPHFAADCED